LIEKNDFNFLILIQPDEIKGYESNLIMCVKLKLYIEKLVVVHELGI